MAKFSTRRLAVEHPAWCDLSYLASNDHEVHTSGRERVPADLPTTLDISAFLVRSARHADPRYPAAPLASLVFETPAAAPVDVLLTFGQLRRLDEALGRLVYLGEVTAV